MSISRFHSKKPNTFRLFINIIKIIKDTFDYNLVDENGPYYYHPGIYINYRDYYFTEKWLTNNLDGHNQLFDMLKEQEIKKNQLEDKENWVKFCEKLNKDEFDRASKKLSEWRKRQKELPSGKKTKIRVEFLENYLDQARIWFIQNGLEEPSISQKKNKSSYSLRISWNGTPQQLKDFHRVLIDLEFINGIDFAGFSKHFDNLNDKNINPSTDYLNWNGLISELAYTINQLVKKGFINKNKKWVMVSNNFLVENRKITADQLRNSAGGAKPLKSEDIRRELIIFNLKLA